MKKIKGVAIINGVASVEIIDNDYRAFKTLLGFDSPITLAERKIGDNYYDIWLDDEGLLKDNHVSAYCSNGHNEYLVGNIFICKNELDKSVSLTDEEVNDIMGRIEKFKTNGIIDYGYGTLIEIHEGYDHITYDI